jgi:hypothetical protein
MSIVKLQKFLPKRNFSLILRVDDGTLFEGVKCFQKCRFDIDFMIANLPDLLEVQRFLICGPPSMNQ